VGWRTLEIEEDLCVNTKDTCYFVGFEFTFNRMLTFLFWNLNKKPLKERIRRLTEFHAIDILMLSECTVPVGEMLEALNQGESTYQFPYSENERIHIYTRFSDQFLHPVRDDPHFSFRHLELPATEDLLLGVVHLRSKLYQSEQSQAFGSIPLANVIREEESRFGHSRTILVGDFNMNPFEEGIVGAIGLHAVMSQSIAMGNSRTVEGVDYPFFYNPMWGHFGDRNAGPNGTYYRSSAEHVNYFWNIFDQVLIRPELIDVFAKDELQILDHDGGESLVSSRNIPDKINSSDHLPILFRLTV